MAELKGLESLGPMLMGEGMPAFDPRKVSPYAIQKKLEEGIAFHQEGKKEDAERCYREVLQQAPNQPDALNLLGVLAAGEGLLGLAIDLVERALRVRPKDPNILNNRGQVQWELRRFDDSRDSLERAVALKPDFDEARYNLARVLRQLNEPEAALRLWREVWEADNRVTAALVGITGILADQGKFDEAEKMAREVIARLPHRPSGYISLSYIKKFTADDGTLAEIESQFADDTIDEDDLTALYYAAGKICDDLKLFDKAFEYFDIANQRALKSYDRAAMLEQRSKKKLVFSKKFFRERVGWGYASDAPVFIVGMPRSGTTLTEQILSAHPDVFAAGEVETFEQMALLSEEVSPSRDPFPLSVLKLTRVGAELVGRRYMKDLSNRAPADFKRVTNKMPHNFELLGLIALCLPGAKIIHCRRDPVDTCLSCWTKNFNDAHAYSRSLTELGLYYREYHALMEHWQEVLPTKLMNVDYESYTTDLEESARKIVDFIGLRWDPRCLEFHSVERPVRTASLWQVRQPIYRTSVQKWRKYQEHLGPLLDALGPLASGWKKQTT